jgi:hypothetical protein
MAKDTSSSSSPPPPPPPRLVHVDFGFSHNPPPIMLILGLHSPTLDAHPPEIFQIIRCFLVVLVSSCRRFLHSESFYAYNDHPYIAHDPAS